MPTAYDHFIEGDCGLDEAAEFRAESIAALADEYESDDDKLRAAEEWVSGTHDGSHYTDLTLALFDLHLTDPDKLMASGLLPRLYALAKVEYLAMRKQLEQMAAEDIAAQDDMGEAA